MYILSARNICEALTLYELFGHHFVVAVIKVLDAVALGVWDRFPLYSFYILLKTFWNKNAKYRSLIST